MRLKSSPRLAMNQNLNSSDLVGYGAAGTGSSVCEDRRPKAKPFKALKGTLNPEAVRGTLSSNPTLSFKGNSVVVIVRFIGAPEGI